MSDTEEEHDQTSENAVLGQIPTGAADTTLGAPPPLRVSRRRTRESGEASRLPRGAWLRLRAAGGIVFRTSETTVFDDGRLTYRSSPTAVYGQTLMARELTEAQVQVLHTTMEATNLEALGARDSGRGRDTISYELTVRADRKTQIVEAAQGTMPEAFGRIVHELGELVRVGADELNG